MSSEGEIELPRRCLSVVVPVYNEERTLAAIIAKLLAVPNILEVVIVDDCSEDGSRSIIERLVVEYDHIRGIYQDRNQGKTAAVKTGIAETVGEIVMIQDADLEYDPSDIPEVSYPIMAGFADVTYGSRFMIRRAARVLYYYHYLANKALTTLSNLLTNLNLTDVETCYKAFRGDIIRNMTITSSGFGFEIEVTAKMAKLKCPIYDVPISYYGRTYEEGKKITYRDGIAAVYYIIRFNVFSSKRSSFKALPNIERKSLN